MKDSILLELAKRLDRMAIAPEYENGAPEAAIGNAKEAGRREGLRMGADAIRMLVQVLGNPDEEAPRLKSHIAT